MPVTSYFQRGLTASILALTLSLMACADQNTADANAEVSQLAAEPSTTNAPEDVQKIAQHSHSGSRDDYAHSAGEGHGAESHTPLILPSVDFATTEAPEDHVMGNATAPVTVISYASVTCPHCGDWFTNEWPQFKSQLIETGKVRFVFREFATQPVQLAMAGFLIANCADETRFFEAIEYQMENQKSIFESAQAGKARETYLAMAQQFGLKDEAAMQACLSNQDEIKRIETSMARAQAGNIKGAPAFIINETLYNGNSSFENLKAAIDLDSKTGMSKMDKR